MGGPMSPQCVLVRATLGPLAHLSSSRKIRCFLLTVGPGDSCGW